MFLQRVSIKYRKNCEREICKNFYFLGGRVHLPLVIINLSGGGVFLIPEKWKFYATFDDHHQKYVSQQMYATIFAANNHLKPIATILRHRRVVTVFAALSPSFGSGRRFPGTCSRK